MRSLFVTHTADFLEIRRDGKLIGVMQVELCEDEGDPVAYVLEIQIQAAWQSQGLGSRLLKHVEDFGLGVLLYTRLTVQSSNAAALRFYALRGYSGSHTHPEEAVGFIILDKTKAASL